MTPERLAQLNENISSEFETILLEQEEGTKTEDQLLAEVYARMIAVSTLGYSLSAMAESAEEAADRIMDLFEQTNTEEEKV